MGPSPEADLNFKKKKCLACEESPGNNFFLLIGCSATPAPLARGLACFSFFFFSLQLLDGFFFGSDSSRPSCARAVFGEYCMLSPALGADHSNRRVAGRTHILRELSRRWNFSRRPQLLARDRLPLELDKEREAVDN